MSNQAHAGNASESTGSPNAPIRVLIVEDSAVQSLLLRRVLEAQGDLLVVGVARDGREALRLAAELAPDLVTMDVQMPLMDGLEATRLMIKHHPRPILVVATLSSKHTTVAQEMLGAGALDVFPKPMGLDGWSLAAEALRERVRALARIRLSARPKPEGFPPIAWHATLSDWGRPSVIAIAASTGGPPALRQILRVLPPGYPVPVIIVQHIAPGFGAGLAQWLASVCALPVRLAEERECIERPGVTVAPDDKHLLVADDGRFLCDAGMPIGSLRPRADLLFSSLARVYGRLTVGIVLTGMGNDGAQGLAEIRRAGGITIAQDQDSSVVYGMPKAAHDAGAAMLVLSLDEIAALLGQLGNEPPGVANLRCADRTATSPLATESTP